MENVIRTEHLTKHFGKVAAVEDISISVSKGEIYGFLGLNGAGKTTTIRMLLGMISPTAGKSYIMGKRVHSGSNGIWNNVGYLVEIPYSYPGLTVYENLEMVRGLRMMKNPGATDQVIEKLRLGPYRDRIAKNLSLGNSQRLGLAKALIHSPEILLLDEPANGLDPAGIVEIRELLLDLAKNRGVTVFISSHILGEISRITTRIGIIHEGRLAQEIDTARLDKLLSKRLLIDGNDRKAIQAKLNGAGYQFQPNDDGILESADEKAIAHPAEIATLLVRAGLPPARLQVDEEDLESYFLRIIGSNGGTK